MRGHQGRGWRYLAQTHFWQVRLPLQDVPSGFGRQAPRRSMITQSLSQSFAQFPLPSGWHLASRQTCPRAQISLAVTHAPAALQVLVASADIDAQAVPQSVPAGRGWQPEPSALHAPVRHAPPQPPAAQHTPCTQVSPVLHPLLAAHACPGPPAGGSCVWQWPALQVCPARHAWLPAAQAPALQILVARVVPSAHALPQSVPSARGSHPEPSARHFPVTQAPLQASAVQHRPPTHPSPLVQAPVLSPHSSPGPRATASHSPVLELQVVPGSHLIGEHFQPEAASHSLHLPEQAWSQQWPATQAPDLHASLPVHGPPRS
jgi:hypothetical protein